MATPSRSRLHDPILWYLSCELPLEGEASHTHIMGITRGLQARGWRVRLWHPAVRRRPRGAVRRFVDIATLQGRLVTQRERPDVLYVRGHYLSLPGVLWARLRGIPVVWEINGPGTDVLSSWPRVRPLLRLLRVVATLQLRASRAIIAVTPALAAMARSQGARQAWVVPNGADTALFSPQARSTLDLPLRYVVFVGTLARWQGLGTVLAALDLPVWPVGLPLVVVGDGVMAGVVRDRVAAGAGLRYLGRIPHDQVAGVVAGSVGALSPMVDPGRSRSGVVPLKLFEAMACGVPVIVTDMPGQADIVRQAGCGVVVAPGDPDSIAAAVALLAADPAAARAMGVRGREAVVERYSWDASAAETDLILRDLLA